MPGKLTQKQLLILVMSVAVLAGGYFAVSSNLRRDTKPPEVRLAVWGVFNEKEEIQKVFDSYRGLRPNVQFTYEYVKPDSYHEKLLGALAAGQGPDIVMMPSRGIPEAEGRLAPAGKDQLTLGQVRQLFPTVVEQDFMVKGEIYALPLYLDTLALIYNRNSFDQVGIAEPPVTWTDFQNIIPALRVVNESGQIVKAAAAVGGTDRNAKNAIDVLYVVMLQNGADMTDDEFTRANFSYAAGGRHPGLEALNFYLQFANAASPFYAWNDNQPNAFDVLGDGRVAMLFGYREDLPLLLRKNPFADLGVAALPQLEGATHAVTYASYWGLAVPKQSKNSWWAWDFIVQFTTNPARVKLYTDQVKRLPALRSLIAPAQADTDLGVFAKQALTARSWHQANEAKIRGIFNTVIDMVLRGQIDSAKALKQAEDQVSELMFRPAEIGVQKK